jgi:hypothetical protein
MLKRTQVKDQSGTEEVRGTQGNRNQELNKQDLLKRKRALISSPL